MLGVHLYMFCCCTITAQLELLPEIKLHKLDSQTEAFLNLFRWFPFEEHNHFLRLLSEEACTAHLLWQGFSLALSVRSTRAGEGFPFKNTLSQIPVQTRGLTVSEVKLLDLQSKKELTQKEDIIPLGPRE